jgi:hypothetical protein
MIGVNEDEIGLDSETAQRFCGARRRETQRENNIGEVEHFHVSHEGFKESTIKLL